VVFNERANKTRPKTRESSRVRSGTQERGQEGLKRKGLLGTSSAVLLQKDRNRKKASRSREKIKKKGSKGTQDRRCKRGVRVEEGFDRRRKRREAGSRGTQNKGEDRGMSSLGEKERPPRLEKRVKAKLRVK